MLNTEELVDMFIVEEGQVLLGLDFLIQVLGFNMRQFEKVFIKTVREYEKRRPLKLTEVLYGDSYGVITMPKGTMSVLATRYGVLPEFPRYFQDIFGYQSFDFTPQTGKLRVYPPITPIKVTFTKGYTITGSEPITGSFDVFSGDTDIIDTLPTSFRKGQIQFTLGDYTLSETERTVQEIEIEGVKYPQEVSILGGTLGTGTFNLSTKELEIEFANDVDITADASLSYSYIPTYKSIEEIGIGDYVFTKFFYSKMLEFVASARAQATQANVHSIDLTEDQLYVRARILKKEVFNLLAQTWDFGAVADI